MAGSIPSGLSNTSSTPVMLVGVAGGMGNRRDRPPMRERVRQTSAHGRDCPARHCWVADPADGSGQKRPGLLMEWRRAAAGPGWQGRVIYAAQLRPGRWAVVEEWVDESLLTPV
jgi:hypothetical protein